MHSSQKTSSILSPQSAHQSVELNVDNPEAIPSYPFVLRFSNLTYSVKISPKMICLPPVCKNDCYKEKLLLKDISGEAKEGQIMAVLGASGSGKSTLIDALAGRISKESLKGSITLNGYDVLRSNNGILSSISAYVMQDDVLFPMLTAEETLMFSAELRLPRTLPRSKKRERVQELINQLRLREAANTMIGDEGRKGISTGERKRVSIGIGIIHNPIILFLDEPTSGLDSTNAFLVFNVLKGIAQAGSIVILTVHQPSSRILSLLDRLIILSSGHTVYSGSPSELSEFLAAYNHPIPEDENRAEFSLDLISKLENSPDGITRLIEFNKSWKMRENPQVFDTNLCAIPLKDDVNMRLWKGKMLTSAEMVPTFVNPFWFEIYVLGKRSLINSSRTPESLVFRFGAVVLTSVMLGTIFWRLDDSPRGAQERLGFFASSITTTIFICAEAIPYFLQEKHIFMRETAHNTYRRSSYVLSHSIISLPPLILLAFTFSTMTFWAVGLAGGLSGFLWFSFFILGSFWAGHSFVTLISTLVPNIMTGYLLVVTLLAQFMLFSGFFITRVRIPRLWIWFHYLSLVKYPYQGVMMNEFENTNKCLVNGIQVFDNTPLKGAPKGLKLRVLESMSESLGAKISSSSCLMRGIDLLEQQGISDLSKVACLCIVFAWGFLFRVLFYLALLFGNKNKRT